MELRPQRWLPAIVLTVAVLGLILTESILAARGTVEILYPRQGGQVSGLVEVYGTATDENLSYYQLEYSRYGREWKPIGPPRYSRPVVGGTLGVWDTSQIPPARYQLRLRLTDKMGNVIQHTIEVTVGGS